MMECLLLAVAAIASGVFLVEGAAWLAGRISRWKNRKDYPWRDT